MRIVSWNMNCSKRTAEGRARAWDYLRNQLHADVALVQEAVPPADRSAVYRRIHETNQHYKWGSAVVALDADVRVQERPRIALDKWDWGERPAGALPESHPGSSAVADVLDASGRFLFTAVSLYGQWEMVGGDRDYYACAKVHRILSDLTDVLAAGKRRSAVLAGDFNLTTQLDRKRQHSDAASGAKAAFDRVRAWGYVNGLEQTRSGRKRLENCLCIDGDACSHVRTFRSCNNSDSRPVQLDYAFVSSAMLPSLVDCRPVDDEAAWALSDHCPILLELR